MKSLTIHLKTDSGIACGQKFSRGGFIPSNSDVAKVTCKSCLKKAARS